MPIRINLLAEEQAAEELRRRDPVKRALWVAGALIGIVLLYIANLQVKILNARSQLRNDEAGWEKMLPDFLAASNSFKASGAIQKRLDSLGKYATNRFLWTQPLSALQFVLADKVRVVRIRGEQTFTTQKEVAVSSNIFAITPKRSLWKFWAKPEGTNVALATTNLLQAITNRTDLSPYQSLLIAEITVTTNPVQIAGKADVIKPETVSEQIRLVIDARDYTPAPKRNYDRFYEALTNSFYYSRYLSYTNSSVEPDTLLPKDDPRDLVNPGGLFIPFTIKGQFPERIRANE